MANSVLERVERAILYGPPHTFLGGRVVGNAILVKTRIEDDIKLAIDLSEGSKLLTVAIFPDLFKKFGWQRSERHVART
mgnify:CR=1 FL=1